jgi:hypothetical protein
MTVSNSNMQIYSHMASASTFLPKNTKHDVEAKRKVEKVTEKEKEKKEKKEKGKGQTLPVAAIFLPNSANKRPPNESMTLKPTPSVDVGHVALDFGLDLDNNDSDSGGPVPGGSASEDNNEDGEGSFVNLLILKRSQ